ncbi:TonB-dependent receptor domain-containing protein [Roseivirga sp. E12]|uniref:TonB-dependent receptor n=1 Tax=Roseivirga sp. E12 TaxID=2819237 RepID=UPI001ABD455C|nr:TonB-dependent receptor [Roseivirga sp. E12]MBO3697622.1 carboxypeptidase-like regulatory domain-containing protein [Roseivirga sp. E12]
MKDVSAQVIGGKVVMENGKDTPIPFANVKLVGPEYLNRAVGVSSDEKGVFILAVKKFPVEIEVSALGFISQKIKLSETKIDLIIRLKQSSLQLDDFILVEEKISEEELKAPIETIKVNLAAIQSTPSFNYFDAVGNLKGVDLTTQSVVINNVNTRGFNSTTNQRFRQFTDGVDQQAPGLSFALGNVAGPSSLDVESIELIPGPSSAFYGPSSFNGVLELKTKNAFDYPGLTFSAKGATASVDKDNSKFLNIGDNFIGEVAGRYSFSIKDRLGIKLNASILNGVDFRARNFDNVGPGNSFDRVHTIENQSINLLNAYGDDRSALFTVPSGFTVFQDENAGPVLIPNPNDTAFTVTRSGYREEDLVDYNASNLKLQGTLQFKINEDMMFTLVSNYAKASAMITNEDRMALRGFEIFQQKAEIQGKKLLLRAYSTQQSAGETYNVGLLADELVQRAKPDEVWFEQYLRFYMANRGIINSRNFAESQFPIFRDFYTKFQPGTQQYDSIRNNIITTRVADGGARIFDKSKLHHFEAKYDVGEVGAFLQNLTFGGNYRLYDPQSAGTIFIDTANVDITNIEYGVFGEFKKELDPRTDLSGSLRYDKNESFDGKFSQRLSLVREAKANQFFRASVQRGFRFPNVREQFYNQNLGDKVLIGGLEQVTDFYELQGNAYIQQSLRDYERAIINTIIEDNIKIELAKLRHIDILANGIVRQDQFRGLEPERITSFEFGYRSLIQDRRVFEVNYYRNYYQNFIGNLRIVKPRTSPSLDLIRAVNQASSPGTSDLIFVTANSEKQIITQGLEVLYDITGLSGINFSVNATFADIIQDADDPLIPGFNTPPFKFNVKVGHRRISRNFGAEFTWRSRTAFDWRSPFADGRVTGFSTFDVQLTFRVPRANSLIRIGGNNVTNNNQFNSYGGPEISAFYYVSFSFDPFQSR